ncbi:MAG TPA: hypothetical protein VKG24_04450 [Pseudolabrys sp.]|nr:hypothetical protein [Pseudolabrys sp.]
MSIVDHPEQWPADFQQTSRSGTVDYVFLARALSRLDRDDIWNGLCSDELKAWGSSIERADFAPIQLAPMRFSNQAAAKDQILDDCTIDAMDHRSVRHRIVRRRIPVPHWIFVTRASLEAFAQAHSSVGAEHRAAQHLADLLTKNPDMSRAQAQAACAQFGITQRGFLNRVWVEARDMARLPRRARAGPKSKHKLKR